MAKVAIPQDDAFIPSAAGQWWYWTGHLKSADGHEFGFFLVFFVLDLDLAKVLDMPFESLAMPLNISLGDPRVVVVQASVTNVTDDEFRFQISPAYQLLTPMRDGFWFSVINVGKGLTMQSAHGGGGKDHLSFEVEGYRVQLDLAQARPPVLHYNGDRHDYSFGGYTYYYSRELMDASGTIAMQPAGGEVQNLEVTGTAWFDRQWGDLGAPAKIGWDWFAIQLEDDTQIMCFNFHGDYPGEDFCCITGADGSTQVLWAPNYCIDALEFWSSPDSGQEYPSAWRITCGDYVLHLKATVADQEILGRQIFGPNFWEGDCSVSGQVGSTGVTGKAYAELQPGWAGT